MHRRAFVKLLGSTSFVALSIGSRALAQKGAVPPSVRATPAATPPGSTAVKPADIVLPDQWSGKRLTDFSKEKTSTKNTVATTSSRATPPSTPGNDTADIRMGVVGPSGRSMPASQALRDKKILHTADDGLNLAEINNSFNPFFQHPLGGAFKKPSEMFRGRTFIPVQSIMGGVIKATSGGTVPSVMQPVVTALSSGSRPEYASAPVPA